MRNRKKWILMGCLLVVFFLGRFLFGLLFGYPPQNDGRAYHSFAMAIRHQSDWLTNANYFGNHRAPFYPVFLAGVYTLFGDGNFFALTAIQAMLSTLVVWYTYILATRILGRETGVLAFLWSGFYVLTYVQVGIVAREVLVCLFMVSSFYHLYQHLSSGDRRTLLLCRHMWLFVVGMTLLVHTDSRYLFYYPFVGILFFLFDKGKVAIRRAVVVWVLLALLLVPGMVRNYIAYDGFVLINPSTLDLRRPDVSPLLPLLQANIKESRVKSYPSEAERELIKQGSNPNNRPPEEIELIKKDVYAPTTFFERRRFALWEMWGPWRLRGDFHCMPWAQYRGPWSLQHNIMSILCYGTLIPFIFLALIVLLRTNIKKAGFLMFPILLQFVFHFIFFARARYRMPISPFLILFGTYGMVVCMQRFRGSFPLDNEGEPSTLENA